MSNVITTLPEDIPVSSLTVPTNRLRELRDVEGLAASMAEIGLLQSIIVSESGMLVSGRHRLEAARRLGWETISAFVVEDDELTNRLIEIDENLRRLDLTVWEQAKHADERERVLDALGQRARQGDNQYRGTATVAVPKTTKDLAQETNMSERSWQKRAKIGRNLGDETAAVLDHADLADEKQRNFLNSTTQLDHLANISKKRGDEVAAQVAELALTEEGGNTFKAYEKVKEEQKERSERKGAQTSTPISGAPDMGPEGVAAAVVEKIERIKEARFTVRMTNGTTLTVPRSRLLKEEGYEKCKHCKGHGLTRKEG